MKYEYVHPPRTFFFSTYTEILPRLPSRGDYSPPLGPQKYSWDDPWQSSFSPRIMKYMIFTPSRRTFVAPSGDVFCSTYNEISTFSPTGAIASGTTIGPNLGAPLGPVLGRCLAIGFFSTDTEIPQICTIQKNICGTARGYVLLYV